MSLGSNLGDKKRNIELAIKSIETQIGDIVSLSAFYFSEPFGFESQYQFINCVARLNTLLSPYEILYKTQKIEDKLGRTEKTMNKEYSDRIIDIDILLYDDIIINDGKKLQIPHAEMHKRDFVLIPLNEIAPQLIHPVFHLPIEKLLKNIET